MSVEKMPYIGSKKDIEQHKGKIRTFLHQVGRPKEPHGNL